ncbi:flavodoxin domain-containing protein [Anaerosporobacter faecicola]|uniref:flavodoxin domain-containing protein n=1 Tax=Anaerosporobacter faecicola TaxID=2718714 RepID=UPI00143C1BB0|nr:4Fe-4S binding protein [Anaerosporobacter faecicola]
MNKEVIIICQSMYHGNTKKIADAMGRVLHCEVISCERAKKMDLSSYACVGLGSGIYFTSHHPAIMEIAKTLQPQQAAFIFSTHGAPIQGKYHEPLKTILKKNGVSVVGEYSCRGYDCTGPYNLYHGGNKGKPNEADLRRAEKFIHKRFPQYKKTVHIPDGRHVGIESETCIGCGRCAAVCPMHVLRVEEEKCIIVKEEDCIHCKLCMEQCTEGAIAVKHTRRELIRIAKIHAKRTSLPQ